jgi:hypothetical protein
MEYSIGMFARSLAGHDKSKLYLISKIEGEYVYLVDGRIRTLDKPKKKRKKHIQIDYQIMGFVKDKLSTTNKLQNEDIKRAIKLKNTSVKR